MGIDDDDQVFFKYEPDEFYVDVEFIRRNFNRCDYEIYVRTLIRRLKDNQIVYVQETKYPLSKEEEMNLLNAFIRNKKIEDLGL